MIEQHRYTTELRLTYALRDPVTGEPDPSAYLRLYHDARQLEATHCYVGRRWQDVIGMYPPPAEVLGHRMRMNTFLGKWLEYLAERGHGVATLHPVDASHSAGDATKKIWQRTLDDIAERPLEFSSFQPRGAIAQLGERLHGMQEVGGSIPPGSTISADKPRLCTDGPSFVPIV